jgi:hypothetical protein
MAAGGGDGPQRNEDRLAVVWLMMEREDLIRNLEGQDERQFTTEEILEQEHRLAALEAQIAALRESVGGGVAVKSAAKTG